MDSKGQGIINLTILEAYLQPCLVLNQSVYLKVLFGTINLTSSSATISYNSLKWNDSFQLVRTSEETLTIGLYNSLSNQKIGSSTFPIQSVISKGAFQGLIFLQDSNKIQVRLKVSIKFQPDSAALEWTRYPIPPPAHLHVHAYAVPPNFTYTPPEYYQCKGEQELIFN